MNALLPASMSALMSAAARAAHVSVDDEPHILDDSIGRALCQAVSPSPLDYQLAQPHAPILAAARLSAVTRSAFTEDRLRASGLHQYIVLGAGLDTSAHRLADGSRVRTWLLDRPEVLAWRARLFALAAHEDAGAMVPCDLSQAGAIDVLERRGLDLNEPAFIAWLGVSMYLDVADVRRVFADFSCLAPGSQLVFDYALPRILRDEAGNAYVDAIAAATQAKGEPWHCTPSPEEVTTWLTEAGWVTSEDVSESDATPPGFWPRTDALHPMGLIRLRRATLAKH